MAVSIITYTADGSTNQFSITFDYISQSHVVVTVDGTSAAFTFINTSTVQLNSTPSSGSKVQIQRVTPVTAIVDFTDGSTLFEADLDLADKQSRFISEEAKDIATDAKTTIDNNIADVNTVAGNSADISTVAGVSSSVSTVAGIAANVTTAAGNTTNINTVAANDANITAVGGISSNVTTVAGISGDVTAVANDATDIGTVSSNISAVTTAASNISAIQNASANAATATTKASEASSSASAALVSQNAAAASQVAAADSAAAAATALDNFDDRYLGSKTSNPTVDNDGNALVSGALYFNSTANEMRVYDGANWIAASSAGTASLILYEYTATSGQTTFSGADDNSASLSYSVGNLQVVMNGIVLDPSDFTATSGTSVVLASGAATDDLVNIYAFKSFTVADTVSASAGGTFAGNVNFTGAFTSQGIDDNATSTAMTLDASGNVGIGVVDPDSAIEVQSSASGINSAHLSNTNSTGYGVKFVGGGNTSARYIADFRDYSGASKLRLDGSGNLLVGTATASSKLTVEQGFGAAATFNRTNNDGAIAYFAKDGTTVGSIGAVGGSTYVSGSTNGVRFLGARVQPCNTSGSLVDNVMDLGFTTSRWDDIYATNGTIQTSDRNEKQDIAELTDAEQRVAVAAKGLMRKFRWRDAVEAKGDDARTHFGIIAQDLQAAFAAEGLDAGDYAMFISTTWWETQTEVPAVEAVAEVLDEEGNVVTEAVEAVDAYTRTDTYDTQEEAPEGATERTRLGVRYSELLAFIIGAL